jgi:hypothetical protein
MLLKEILMHLMKKQDVKKIQKTIIENSISNIWKNGKSTRKRDSNSEFIVAEDERKHCVYSRHINFEAKNLNNSNYNCFPSLSETSLSDSLITDRTVLSCTCSRCEHCKCNTKVSFFKDQSESSSCSMNSEQCQTRSSCSSDKKKKQFIIDENIINKKKSKIIIECEKPADQEYGNKIKCKLKADDVVKKTKKKKFEPILFFFIHILLYFVAILLKSLCYVKYSFLYLSAYKSFRVFLVFLTVAVSILKVSNFDYFCNLSNAINRILYSQNDALAKIMDSDGKLFFYSTHTNTEKKTALFQRFFNLKAFLAMNQFIYILLKQKTMV